MRWRATGGRTLIHVARWSHDDDICPSRKTPIVAIPLTLPRVVPGVVAAAANALNLNRLTCSKYYSFQVCGKQKGKQKETNAMATGWGTWPA